jgi:hypothetical protein
VAAASRRHVRPAGSGSAERAAVAPTPTLLEDDWTPALTSSADLVVQQLATTEDRDETDDEMAAYNKYLEKLNARSQRSRQ